MKKIISLVLVLVMVLCMVPAFAVSADEPEMGLNATFWHSVAEVEDGESGHADAWRRLMGWHGMGKSTSYDTNEQFDKIDQMVKISYEWPAFGNGNLTFAEGFDRDTYHAQTPQTGDNDYMVKWTGTMTVKSPGTYTFVANALDNGVAIFVDGGKAFEWWGPDSWFDEELDPLLSKYSFTVTEEQAGQPIEFEMWFLEMFGDERLRMAITADGTAASQTSFADAGITFNLSANYYTLLLKGDEYDDLLQYMTQGEDNKDASNPANHTFSEDQLTSLKGEMIEVGSAVLPNLESNSWFEKPAFEQFGAHYDCFMVEYDGYITPATTGTYQFGASKVDNCFILMIEIDGEWKTAFEFWAKGIWNDVDQGGQHTYSADEFELEEGVSYKIRAIFLELDGGEPLNTLYKINGTECTVDQSGIVFSTESLSEDDNNGDDNNGDDNNGEVTPPETGDIAAVVAIVAVLSIGTAVIVTKKRQSAK